MKAFDVRFGNGRSLFVIASSLERAHRLAEQYARDEFLQPATVTSIDPREGTVVVEAFEDYIQYRGDRFRDPRD
jgi:hypothetical protein